MSDLVSLFAGLARPRVLVLGDLILDRYTWGDAERVSQEAPVILLRADKREARLGGAANVCNMLRGLEAEVRLAGVVGDDDGGRLVRRMLRELGVDDSLVLYDAQRPTTTKERFIGRAQGRHPHQILRVDDEVRDPLRPELVHELSTRLAAALEHCDVVLISDYDKGVCTPRLLRQVIGNLLHNALKYSTAGQMVLIKVTQSECHFSITIKDEGIGVPQDDLKRLFEPFHRASNVGAIAGTGLGLSIALEAVELHGGAITVDSEVGTGTIFTVVLPKTQTQNDPNCAPTAETNEA